jgi:hypothetical protein
VIRVIRGLFPAFFSDQLGLRAVARARRLDLVTSRFFIAVALAAAATVGAAVGERVSQVFTANDGSLQSIRGIKGIDTVMLQNLEAVLRMQAPPPPPQAGGGGGGVRAAAELLTMENEESPDPQDESDGREELTELELEGS